MISKKEIMTEFDEYVAVANKKEEKELNKQGSEGVRECRRILKILRRKKRVFRKEMKTIENKIIPYTKRMKWTPLSYRHMLAGWEYKYLQFRRKK